jgi:hypothetical protein
LLDSNAYQDQLDRLRAMVQQAETSLAAGRGEELDLEALHSRVRRRAVQEGRCRESDWRSFNGLAEKS